VPVATRAFALDADSARVVAIADTHGHPHPRALERVAAERPACILHGGDIGDLGVLDAFGAIAPVIAVRGNIDSPVPGIPETLLLTLSRPAAPELRVLLTHIAVYGPRLNAGVKKLAAANRAGLVVCGHSHVPFILRSPPLWVFNPGSVGPRRFHLPIVFGVIELTPDALHLEHVDCETGSRWLPPAPSPRPSA
jgi:putative phosphoesterase